MSCPRTSASRCLTLVGLLLTSFLVSPAWAQSAASAPASNAASPSSEDVARELRELRAMRQDLQRQMGEFDNRIRTLETQLQPGGAAAPPQVAGTASQPGAPELAPGRPGETRPATSSIAAGNAMATAEPGSGQTAKGFAGFMERKERAGTYDRNLGYIVADGDQGLLSVSFTTYVRYLNQNALDDTYTDSFGRVKSIDLRNEVQLNKVSLNFKGWLFDPKFQYLLFAWTNNANQGEGAQVVLAGFLRYKFANWLTVTGGIMPLPSTRSTNWSFPKWLRHDNRVMADEFYRASYTSGIDVAGTITKGLDYRVMLGNNLSTLGVSSRQLDNKMDTISGALTWTPTTGEFGENNGFGDYDYHEKLATLLAVYYTQSTETAQGQPSADDFENSQIRLTDGTLLFSPDPFGTGGKIEKARYRMAGIDAGVKYKGFSLEGQWYWRWVDNFKTIGFVPVDKLYDNGFALQASAMPIKDLLQVYGTASKIWGPQGNPTEYGFGVNVYPFRRREMHVNFELLKLNNSPVGGYHLPVQVGSDGFVFMTDWVVMF